MMMKGCPLFAMIPAVILLVISFFVLSVKEKVSGGALKSFGLILSIILWIFAAAIIAMGAYMAVCGTMPAIKCPMVGQ